MDRRKFFGVSLAAALIANTKEAIAALKPVVPPPASVQPTFVVKYIVKMPEPVSFVAMYPGSSSSSVGYAHTHGHDVMTQRPIMPIGMICAWAADWAPDGWKLLDNEAEAIAYSWSLLEPIRS